MGGAIKYISFKVKDYGLTAKAKIPNSGSQIYIGSSHFDRKKVKTFSFKSWQDYRLVGIVDESILAQQVAAELFPQNPTFETSLAVEHEGLFILSSPSEFN